MSQSVAERVKEVVARQLRVPIEQVTEEAHFVEDLGAESIQSLELVAAFEEEFDIEMDEEEALQVKTVGGAIEYISRKLQEEGR